MKLKVYSVRDNRVGVYKTPFYKLHTGEALRDFEDLCNDPQTIVSKHPNDYTLYEIGEYDQDQGEHYSTKPQLLVNASDMKKIDNNLR